MADSDTGFTPELMAKLVEAVDGLNKLATKTSDGLNSVFNDAVNMKARIDKGLVNTEKYLEAKKRQKNLDNAFQDLLKSRDVKHDSALGKNLKEKFDKEHDYNKDNAIIDKGDKQVSEEHKMGMPVQVFGFSLNAMKQITDAIIAVDNIRNKKAGDDRYGKPNAKPVSGASILDDILSMLFLGLASVTALWNEFTGTLNKYSGIIRLIGKTLMLSAVSILEDLGKWGFKLLRKIPGFQAAENLIGSFLVGIKNKVFGIIEKGFGFVVKNVEKIPKVGKALGGILTKAGGFLGKMLGKVLKFLPLIGTLFDFWDAYNRFSQGDWLGGIISTIGGLVNLVPGVGAILSFGLGMLNAFLDYQSDGGKTGFKASANNWLSNAAAWIGDFVMKYGYNIPILSTILYGVDAWKAFTNGEMANGIVNLIKAIPGLGPMLGDGLAFVLDLFGVQTETKEQFTGKKVVGGNSWTSKLVRSVSSGIRSVLRKGLGWLQGIPGTGWIFDMLDKGDANAKAEELKIDTEQKALDSTEAAKKAENEARIAREKFDKEKIEKANKEKEELAKQQSEQAKKTDDYTAVSPKEEAKKKKAAEEEKFVVQNQGMADAVEGANEPLVSKMSQVHDAHIESLDTLKELKEAFLAKLDQLIAVSGNGGTAIASNTSIYNSAINNKSVLRGNI